MFVDARVLVFLDGDGRGVCWMECDPRNTSSYLSWGRKAGVPECQVGWAQPDKRAVTIGCSHGSAVDVCALN